MKEKLRLFGIRKSEQKGFTIITLVQDEVKKSNYFEGYNEEAYFFGVELYDKLAGQNYVGKEVELEYHLESRGTSMRKVPDKIIINGKNILE